MFKIKELMKDSGILYLGFPPWQMPFGGHQQMAESKFLANAPWIHLLPRWLFGAVFRLFGATGSAVESFLRLRDTGISIERFERLVNKSGYRVVNRLLYLINPHYRVKFGLKPRVLPSFIARVPYLRDFFTTTCYYLLKKS
jgi:hypothetical protein